MSECVVRMEIPKGCEDCPFRDFLFCCCAKGRKYAGSSPVRPDWCPILCQLPEGHGRLVDADAMADDVRSLWDYKTVDGITATTVLNQTLTDIRNCPTIVPAEAESPSPKPTDPVPIRDVYYVMTECDVKTGTVKYELRERSET